MARRTLSDWRAAINRSPENVDRLLVGCCALIWLVLLGMSVAAIVALVDLGRGFHEPSHNSHTGLLYIVIGVSALIILAAIPMLLRARRITPRSNVVPPYRGAGPIRSGQPSARRAGGAAAPLIGPYTGAVERILLRGTAELAGAIGTALTVVAFATYLMAVGKDTASWVGYGVAGFLTVLMPVIPWRYVRQLPAAGTR